MSLCITCLSFLVYYIRFNFLYIIFGTYWLSSFFHLFLLLFFVIIFFYALLYKDTFCTIIFDIICLNCYLLNFHDDSISILIIYRKKHKTKLKLKYCIRPFKQSFEYQLYIYLFLIFFMCLNK